MVNGVETKGNFDTGEFEVAFLGETVVRIKLDALNQNRAGFDPSLMGALQSSYEKAYRLGRRHAKGELIAKINEL